jgi:hypothetical protein
MLTWLHPRELGACRAEVEGIMGISNCSFFQYLLLRKSLKISTTDDWFSGNILIWTNHVIVIAEASSV